METDLSKIVSETVFENNPLKVCYSGQLLKGVVKISFPSNTYIQGIYIKFVGEGFYSWVDDISDREKTGAVNYLVKRIDLVARSDGRGLHVSAGNNEYSFEIPLPSNLPTSFEGTYGHNRYTLALCVAPSGTGIISDPVSYVETFTVIKPLNLNRNFSYIMPTEVEKAVQFDYSFTRLCVFFRWKKGYLKIYGRPPVSGYCSGQIMNLNLDVSNESGQGVSVVVIHFIKEVTYNAKDGSKKIETVTLITRKIKGFRGSECGNQSKKIKITVPSVPPTSFQSTNDVCVFKYMLRVTAVTDLWLEKNPFLEIPITIGTNPITNEMYNSVNRQSFRQIFPPAPFEQLLPIEPSAPPLHDSYLPNNSNTGRNAIKRRSSLSRIFIDPPTYEEIMRSERSTGNHELSSEFTPSYPDYSAYPSSYSNENF